jgi:molybdopterin-guanine dinucleotide biosynthesis protein MobB
VKKIVSIVGMKKSGKTTLIEKLVPILKEKGYKVGTIKHDAHSFEIDHPGTDSYRHFKAGANTTIIASKNKTAIIKRSSSPIKLEEIAERFLYDMDIIITEGYKKENKPKIEVTRSNKEKILCSPNDNLIAVASDYYLELSIPSFNINDIESIAEFIEERFLKKIK